MENNPKTNLLMHMVAQEATYDFVSNEYTDKITNEIMDYLRIKLSINPQSDKDDLIYGQIWMMIKLHNTKTQSKLNK